MRAAARRPNWRFAARRVFGEALLERFPFSAFVSKTVTLAPRQGNPPPRLWELPAGLLNSIGLPNKGLSRYLAEDLPQLAELSVPLIVNVMGFSGEEVAELVQAFASRPQVAALELNVSCPNVETGLVMGADHASCPGCCTACDRSRPAADRQADAQRLRCRRGGPSGAGRRCQRTVSDQHRPGHGPAPAHEGPLAGRGTGGLSGPAVQAIALAHVQAVAAVALPIVAMGGVGRGRDPAELLSAGAELVAVGTESFRDPSAGLRIAAELAEISLLGPR